MRLARVTDAVPFSLLSPGIHSKVRDKLYPTDEDEKKNNAEQRVPLAKVALFTNTSR